MNDPDTSAAAASPTDASPTDESVPGESVSGESTTGDSVSAPELEGQSPADLSETDPSTSVSPPPEPVPHAGARYAGLRLLMLVAVGGILYLIGLRGWLLAFAAVLISGVVSLFLLMKQRNDAAINLERQLEALRHRHPHEDAGLAQD